MRIAVNTRFLLKNKLEGIGWFSYETLKRITQRHPEHEFLFFFDRPFDERFIFAGNVTPIVLRPPARHPLLWYYWFERAIPRALENHRADLFFSPDGFLSLKATTSTVITIHDIAFEHYPDHVGFWARHFYRRFTPQYAGKAARITTVSEFSKQDISTQYSIPETKIDVVHNGANAQYQLLSDEEKASVKACYTEGHDYFLYAGAIQPRKNVRNTLEAFDLFKTQHPSTVKLVIAGRKAWDYKGIMRAYEQMRHKSDVVFAGHLPSGQLSRVMGASLGLIYASLFEGFGIPIVEAMNAEVPVITSNVSSMPEVAGDAALLVNPKSPDEITKAMARLCQEPGLARLLVKKGRQQRQNFSWDQTANSLWESLEQTLFQARKGKRMIISG